MKMWSVLFGLFLISPQSFAAQGTGDVGSVGAASLSVDCDEAMGLELFNSSMADQTALLGGGTIDSIFIKKDGKYVLNTASKRIVGYDTKTKGKIVVTYKKNYSLVPDGKPIMGNETVTLITNDDGFVVGYDYDKQAVDKSYGITQLPKSSRWYGKEKSFKKTASGRCSVEQELIKANGKLGMNTYVVADKKFCDSVKDVLRDLGRKGFDQCQDLLNKASKSWATRSMELNKENKIFATPSEDAYGSTGATMGKTIFALRSCAPEEWVARYQLGLGMTVPVLKGEKDPGDGYIPAPKDSDNTKGTR